MQLDELWGAIEIFASCRPVTDAKFLIAEASQMNALKSRTFVLPAAAAQELAAKVLLLSEGQELEDRSAPSVALWLELRALIRGEA